MMRNCGFEEKKREFTTKYSGFWRKNEEKIGQKMAVFDLDFLAFS